MNNHGGKICECCGQPLPEFGGIILDDDRGEVRFGGAAVNLTCQETEILRFLLSKRGRCATKEALYDRLYQLHTGGEDVEIKIIDVFVCKLRKKLSTVGISIGTSWGRGYFLNEPNKQEQAA